MEAQKSDSSWIRHYIDIGQIVGEWQLLEEQRSPPK